MVIKRFGLIIFFSSIVHTILVFAQASKPVVVCNAGGEEFIIKKDIQVTPKVRSHSKNRLKEDIGSVTRKAFNSTANLGKAVGNVKIGLVEKVTSFYQAESGKIAAEVDKNHGMLQVDLSDIQSCFSTVISDLVENRGFFKKASRADLRECLSLMEEMVVNLNSQVTLFNDLKSLLFKKDLKVNTRAGIFNTHCDTSIYDKVKQQFCSGAGELKKLQEKIKTSKCIKKSA